MVGKPGMVDGSSEQGYTSKDDKDDDLSERECVPPSGKAAVAVTAPNVYSSSTMPL
jgi:hypothetical protein